MLDMSDEALAVVQSSYTVDVRAEVWLAGELLTDAVPVADGSETRDRSLSVPESVTLTVPRVDRGVTWDPGADIGHPLASYGQQVRVDFGVDLGTHTEWINRGSYLITDTEVDGDTVTVSAAGLLTLIDEAKLVTPFQPAASDTLISTARALVEPALTCAFDAALADQNASDSMTWDSERLDALADIATAWSADYRVTEDALLYWEPLTDDGDPEVELTDGAGGTVVQWQGSTSRDGAFNCVICQGELADGTQIQGVAYDGDPTSPFLYGGPFNPFPVPYTTESSLMTTVAMCRKAAATTLLRLRRQNGRRLSVSMVPHPGIIAGTIVSVTGAGLRSARCVVESMTLPYGPSEQTLIVRVLS
jgi:hypothetical protein